jgi:hypothetical protein
MMGDGCDSRLDEIEAAEVDKALRSPAKPNSSKLVDGVSAEIDTDREDREGFLIVIGREGT